MILFLFFLIVLFCCCTANTSLKGLEIYNKALRLQYGRNNNQEEIIEIIELYQNSISNFFTLPHSHNQYGLALLDAKEIVEAISEFCLVLSVSNDDNEKDVKVGSYSNIGLSLQALAEKFVNESDILKKQAIKVYDKALALNPNHIGTLANKGKALLDLNLDDEAEPILLRVLSQDPHHCTALLSLGMSAFSRTDYISASQFYEKCFMDIEIAKFNANTILALNYYGTAQLCLRNIQNAQVAFEKLLQIQNDNLLFLSNILAANRDLCYWENYEILSLRIFYNFLKNKYDSVYSISPYNSLLLPFSSKWKLQVAERFTKKSRSFEIQEGINIHSNKLKIAYISFDFREHPMCYLTLGLFEFFNKKDFELFCFGYSHFDNSSFCGKRIKELCNFFYDIEKWNFDRAGKSIVESNVNIAIDLMGHTTNSRLDIVLRRPAPIIVTYLGFPSTTGSSNIDYAIIDKVIAPPESSFSFSEKLVYLPHSYQANFYNVSLPFCVNLECKRNLRLNHNIPRDAFVFASFSREDKLEPVVFESWLRILQRSPNSVLLIYYSHVQLENYYSMRINLFSQAASYGIPVSKFIFITREQRIDHLFRMGAADLILDTFFYGSHTTAADALWSGLPILTLEGESFASKVAASLLYNLQLKELITHSIKEYEDLAVFLSQNKLVYSRLSKKLTRNLLFTPVFNSTLQTQCLEKSYKLMWDVYKMGKKLNVVIPAENDEVLFDFIADFVRISSNQINENRFEFL